MLFIVFCFVVYIRKNNTLSYNFKRDIEHTKPYYQQADAFLQSVLNLCSYFDAMRDSH